MLIALMPVDDVYVLPDEFAGVQLMVVDGAYHLATIRTSGYFDPPLCGRSTASRNVSRKRMAMESVIEVCDRCLERVAP